MKGQDADKNQLPKRWIRCQVEADYFGDERKTSKHARKLASAKDRSKYKKTDQKKQAKQVQEAKIDTEHLERGRVLSIASQGVLVDVNDQPLLCTLRGLLKKEKTHAKNLLTVGDWVLIERSVAEEGLIMQVEPRHTVLSRADNLSRRKEQLIAANIDQVLITASVVTPLLKPSLIDRYIIATQKGGMQPVVVVNKLDLLTSDEVDAEVLAQEKELYKEVIKAYRQADIPVISVSVTTGEGLDDLRAAMVDKASVFSGQSGVGKSSLINAITGQTLRVGEMVEKTKKGSHTTTMAQLLRLDFGGWCIDTPGIKSFGVWDLEMAEVEHYFTEIFSCGHRCRFPDCTHRGEEGCAVISAVEKGEISPMRFDSYLALIQSVSEAHQRR